MGFDYGDPPGENHGSTAADQDSKVPATEFVPKHFWQPWPNFALDQVGLHHMSLGIYPVYVGDGLPRALVEDCPKPSPFVEAVGRGRVSSANHLPVAVDEPASDVIESAGQVPLYRVSRPLKNAS